MSSVVEIWRAWFSSPLRNWAKQAGHLRQERMDLKLMKQHLLSCAKFFGWLCWLFIRETVEIIVMSLGVFYLGASFGRQGVQPHFLSRPEAWAVFIQLMNVFFTKVGRCGQ